ncbi:hypothetical protein [Roseimaritima ulvae]|uniref:Gingipain domain-containing protein n=1 Tax=Roseimaritima ulvae TaxID=980254 RepID=A0A5B9QRH5_9BACT|nr:hypothetical protein [Roseimaritima ulvae]QEG40280.1 hypothetical protein UC8_22870 [Roseimaritima ulvae]
MNRLALTSAVLLTLFVRCGWSADYAIVVSESTQQNPQWQAVVKTLADKHQTTEILVWGEEVAEVLDGLSEVHPRYTCFVATSAEASRQFVADVHQLTRRLDDDPYTDTLWGVLTGVDADAALRIAKTTEPLTIRKVASGTEVALEMCEQGLWYDELVQHKKVERKPDGIATEQQGPADTTHALADALTDYAADLFVTSGHATERDWQIGFRYRNGSFRSQAGQMFGVTSKGERFSIQSTNPKVYLPIGNCLMGHIDGSDAMALAWMNAVGVRQMIGYTVVTWYGYGGWGVLDYFVEQPGRYTLAEAFHANHHALIHRLDTGFDNVVDRELPVGHYPPRNLRPNATGVAMGLTGQDAGGLLWDRDVVAFYGDPAWSARMKKQDLAFEQTLVRDGDLYTLTITPNRGEDSFRPINENGSQRGGRPIIAWLPQRVSEIKIRAGEEFDPVITDDFVLIPNPGECDPSRTYRIIFSATAIE